MQTGFGAALDLAGFQQTLGRLPQGDTAFSGERAHVRQALGPDTAGGNVHHALEGCIIPTIMYQSQVGDGVADFLAVVEPQAPVDSIRNTLTDQGFFQHPRLGVGTVENGRLAAQVTLVDPATNGVGDVVGFVLLVEGRIQTDGLAIRAVGPEFLAQPALVVGNHRVGGFQDQLRGAVILFQSHHPGVGKVPLVLLDVFDFRASPAVDGLVVVAHHR